MNLEIVVLVGCLFSIIKNLKDNAVDKVKYCVPAVIIALLEVVKILYKEELSDGISSMAIGGCLIFISMYNILNKLNCNEKIKGKYIGAKKDYIGRGVVKYRPRFVYIVSGQTFENITLDSLFEGNLEDIYKEGKKYYIYMNPEEKNKIVCKKRISFIDILILLFGLMFIFMAFTMHFES